MIDFEIDKGWLLIFFLMIRRTASSTLFPYTTLFRSEPMDRRELLGKISPGTSGVSCSDRKSTRLNSSHPSISYAVFCLKKKNRRCCVCSCHYDVNDLLAKLQHCTPPA